MAIGLRTPTAPPIETKKVTPEGLDPTKEWFEILSYLDDGTLKNARTAATKTITQNGRTREDFDRDAYAKSLVDAQLKGWQLEVPANYPFDGDTMSNDGGMVHWRFTQTNIAYMLSIWDVRSWLENEIQSCGGVIATAGLVVKTDSGQTLDYKSPPTGVADQQGAEPVSDPLGNAPVAESTPGA